MKRRVLVWVAMCACADAPSNTPDAGAIDASAMDAAAPDAMVDWHVEHCRDRECTYVMQEVAGADDVACNGRHPIDLGTIDADGKRNCPLKSFMNRTVRDALSRSEERRVGKEWSTRW